MSKTNPELKCADPEYCFIVYLDSEYKETNFNIEFCEAVEKFGRDVGDIKFQNNRQCHCAFYCIKDLIRKFKRVSIYIKMD